MQAFKEGFGSMADKIGQKRRSAKKLSRSKGLLRAGQDVGVWAHVPKEICVWKEICSWSTLEETEDHDDDKT